MIVVALCVLVSPASADEAPATSAQIFSDMVRAAQSAGTARVESSQVLEASAGGRVETTRPLESVYVFSEAGPSGPQGVIRLKGFRITISGGDIFVEHADVPDGFVRLSRGENALDTLREGFRSLPDPLLVIEFAAEDASVWLEALDETADGVRLELVSGRVEDGVRKVVLGRDATRLTLRQDVPSGRMIEAMLDRLGPPEVPEGVRLRSTWTYSWASLDQDESVAAIGFQRRGRLRLDDVAALRVPLDRNSDGGDESGGQQAPPLRLESLDGEWFDLSMLEGQVVVLDFWATWCPPCRRGLPEFQKLSNEYDREQANVLFLAVNVMERCAPDQRMDVVRRFMESQGLDLKVAIDRDGNVVKEWGIDAIPLTVVIGPRGDIVARIQGFQPGMSESLRKEIDGARGVSP